MFLGKSQIDQKSRGRCWCLALATLAMVLVAAAASPPARAASITLDFDFTYDTQNFFNTPQRIDILELAGHMISRQLDDDLLAINPGGSNSFDPVFSHPGTGAQQQLQDPPIPADTLVVYVGGRDLGAGGPLGSGGPGGFSTSGTQQFVDTVVTRGEPGADDVPATDFGPWGGSITFNNNPAKLWHFASTTAGLEFNESDFLSVAMHEIGHLLGFGTANSWNAQVAGLSFTGAASVAEYDLPGNVPLDGDQSHWQEDITDGGVEVAMDPTIIGGTRKLFTDLDFAALEDIGWDIVPHLVGDGSENGAVGPEDYTLWANNFGVSGVAIPGDYNDSLTVGPEDYTLWANQFGMSSSFPAAIPEPSALALALAAFVTLMAAARKR